MGLEDAREAVEAETASPGITTCSGATGCAVVAALLAPAALSA